MKFYLFDNLLCVVSAKTSRRISSRWSIEFSNSSISPVLHCRGCCCCCFGTGYKNAFIVAVISQWHNRLIWTTFSANEIDLSVLHGWLKLYQMAERPIGSCTIFTIIIIIIASIYHNWLCRFIHWIKWISVSRFFVCFSCVVGFSLIFNFFMVKHWSLVWNWIVHEWWKCAFIEWIRELQRHLRA